MTLLANIEQLTPEQLDLMQQKIMIRKQELLQKQVEELAEITAKLQTTVTHQMDELETLQHRVDNFDLTNIDGTPQQRFNKMIRLYVAKNGIQYNKGYREFIQAFNTAYRTNLTMLHENYMMRYGKCTLPEFLTETNRIEDAIRVADKMLNRNSSRGA